MPCYSPLQAFQTGSGDIVFNEHKTRDIRRTITLPCGQCIGCKLERGRQWAVRCTHEAKTHEENSFVTLTYADEHLPPGGNLKYDDFQRFLKRLRKHTGPKRVRFYMCGEYGETNPQTGEQDGGLYRPHYHACLFGKDWPDKKFHTRNGQGDAIYTSEKLDAIWGLGQCTTADVTFQSAGYVARYCTKKISGKAAAGHYEKWGKEIPEFGQMSLKPGIGAAWLEKYKTDVYPWDHVVINGKETKPPKYYDRLFERNHPDTFDQIKADREVAATRTNAENTPARLAAKEQVTRAAIRQLKRT